MVAVRELEAPAETRGADTAGESCEARLVTGDVGEGASRSTERSGAPERYSVGRRVPPVRLSAAPTSQRRRESSDLAGSPGVGRDGRVSSSESMGTDSFATLLRDAQNGRPEAFAQLYRTLQPALLRYLWVGLRDRAEDVAAETWVEVVKRLDRFDGDETGFRAWIFTIARSKAIDAGRKDARTPPTTAWDPVLDQIVVTGDLTAETVEEHLSTERAIDLIRLLPPDQAEAVTLRVVAGLDVARVAEIMERSSGSVRVLTHRGLKKLASLVQVVGEREDLT